MAGRHEVLSLCRLVLSRLVLVVAVIVMVIMAEKQMVRLGGLSPVLVVYAVILALLLGFASGWLVFAGPLQPMLGVRVTKIPPPVSPPPPGMRWVEVLTTAYCPCPICCGEHADGRTAINRDVQRHPFGIAVEPKLIPYRTELDIPGYGRALVDDTGGAMRQSATRDVVHLDLRFKTHDEARQWGRRWMWIWLPEDSPAAQRYGLPPSSP